MGAIKAIEGYKLRVLGIPYGSPNNLDGQGDYFSPRTDLMLVGPGQKIPVIYYHGRDDFDRPVKPEMIGIATYADRDLKGVWFDVVLDKAKSLARRVWDAAKQGLARASSGTINYLVRRASDGELLCWPVGELTLLEIGTGKRPANPYAVALPVMKAHYVMAGLELPGYVRPEIIEEILEEILQ